MVKLRLSPLRWEETRAWILLEQFLQREKRVFTRVGLLKCKLLWSVQQRWQRRIAGITLSGIDSVPSTAVSFSYPLTHPRKVLSLSSFEMEDMELRNGKHLLKPPRSWWAQPVFSPNHLRPSTLLQSYCKALMAIGMVQATLKQIMDPIILSQEYHTHICLQGGIPCSVLMDQTELWVACAVCVCLCACICVTVCVHVSV